MPYVETSATLKQTKLTKVKAETLLQKKINHTTSLANEKGDRLSVFETKVEELLRAT
jgi:hypothetical protein